MEVIIHNNGSKIVEFCSDKPILNSIQDAFDLMVTTIENVHALVTLTPIIPVL